MIYTVNGTEITYVYDINGNVIGGGSTDVTELLEGAYQYGSI